MRKIILTICGFALVFPVYFFVVKYFYPEMSLRGQFGDMFGGVNALFSGLAFLGVVYTMWLQREELKLQRTELELTRKELTRAASAQEKSERALTKQADSLRLTAKLNGLSSILQLCISRRDVGIAKYGPGGVDRKWDEKATEIQLLIQEIIDQK